MARWNVTVCAVTAGLWLFAPLARAEDAAPPADAGNLNSYIEVLRSDIRTQKTAIITQAMHFSDEQAKVFWPIQRDYENQLSKITDQRIEVIKEYARDYDTMDDAKANRLAERYLALDADRLALKERYYKKFKKALGAKTAARFIQLENRMNLLGDLQLASNLPLMK